MSDSEQAMRQIARTPFGSATTMIAAKAAQLNHQSESSGSWLLEGVVYQRCLDCDKAFYPARPLCPDCLSEQFEWQNDSSTGRVLSLTKLHISFNYLYRDNVPWSTGFIKHANGPCFYAFLAGDVTQIGDEVRLFTAPDVIGEAVFIAVEPRDDAQQLAQSLAARLVSLPQPSD